MIAHKGVNLVEGSTQINQFDGRDVYYSILVLCGPRHLESELGLEELRQNFSKVVMFVIPDDYGEFPDTSGYTSEKFKDLETDVEDPALFKQMQKCVDAVVEYNNKKIKHLVRMDFTEVEGIIASPKFGGKVFAVAGIVKAIPPGAKFTKMAVPMKASMN